MVSRTDMSPGEIISYVEMCLGEGVNLQQGMNFRRGRDGVSVILMSTRPGAPYADRFEEDGRVLIYEGHDVPRTRGGTDPKTVNQILETSYGTPPENGKFSAAAKAVKDGGARAIVRVYDKIRSGVWVYVGTFALVDSWPEQSNGRGVFEFRLEAAPELASEVAGPVADLAHTRAIPLAVVREVWKRDKGRCTKCGSTTNLHLDHVIPFSHGGSSLVAANIQLLCARHNLEKRDKIGYA